MGSSTSTRSATPALARILILSTLLIGSCTTPHASLADGGDLCSVNGDECDGGYCFNGECQPGCWIPDAGFMPPTFPTVDAGCFGCHPEIDPTMLTALLEGTQCADPFPAVCTHLYEEQSDGGIFLATNVCACAFSGDVCSSDNPYTVPCCGRCVDGHCCVSSEGVLTGEGCRDDSNCCDNGKCVFVNPGDVDGICTWDAGT
jgi:hypothetical protein